MTTCDVRVTRGRLLFNFRGDPACKKKPNTQKGFTLVEVLIVVLIMGIVTMMCLPIVRRVTRREGLKRSRS